MQENVKGVAISLEGKNAIVTGGGGGMGRCTALMLAAAGANLVVSDVNAETAEATAREAIEKYGVKAVATKCNVTVKSEVDAMVELSVKTLGRIDILNHVAGVFGAVDFMKSTEADYDKQMDINAKGTYFVDQAVLRIMIPNPRGQDREYVLPGRQVRLPHQRCLHRIQVRRGRYDPVPSPSTQRPTTSTSTVCAPRGPHQHLGTGAG